MADDNTDNSSNNTPQFSAILFFWKLSGKLNKLSKGCPVWILFFLIGFYCATTSATFIGQSGHWDILSAGLAIAIVKMPGRRTREASGEASRSGGASDGCQFFLLQLVVAVSCSNNPRETGGSSYDLRDTQT